MKYFKLFSLVFLLMILFVAEAYSQCPMCRMTVEANYADGGSAGLGLNKGIIYLLAAPYVIVGTLAFLWWKNNRKNTDQTVPEIN